MALTTPGQRKNRAMRFGLITQWFDPEPGPAAIPGGLARELARRGHEVHVLTGFPNYPTGRIYEGYRMRPMTEYEESQGVKVRRVALYPSHDRSLFRRLGNYASFGVTASTLGLGSMKGMDAIWVYNSPATVALPMWGSKWIWGVPHVLHVMDLWPDSILFGGFGNGANSRGLRAVDSWVSAMYRSSSRVAYASPGLGPILESRGVPREKLAYAPVWADAGIDTHADPVSRSRWGVTADQLLVLYAGAIGSAQGLDALLRAVSLIDQPDSVVLLVAGTGTEVDALQEQARSGGQLNVHFLGHMNREELSGIMVAADVHVISLKESPLSSVSLPSKLHTTLALGKPFISAVAGDAARVASESGAAFPAIPGDPNSIAQALQAALQCKGEGLRKRGDAGRKYYEETFDLHVGVDRVEQLLIDAAYTGGRRR